MRILIAEDELDVAMHYKIALEARNHEVVVTYDGEQCLNAYNDESKRSESKTSPFDAVVLDYRMPKRDGMEVAKEILAQNPRERIIFASAYVKETLVDSVKQLQQVVELMQKPFKLQAFVDTIEDTGIYQELEKLNVNVRKIKNLDPSHEQIKDLLEGLKVIQKGRTF